MEVALSVDGLLKNVLAHHLPRFRSSVETSTTALKSCKIE
jgi:hypothetical protein